MKKILLLFVFSSQLAMAQTAAPISIDYIPTGGILPFQNTCPSGWSVYTRASGRFLLGSGSGNNDANGVALKTRTTGMVGGLEYTSGIPATTHDSFSNVTGPSYTLGSIGSVVARVFYIQTGYVLSNFEDTTINGDKADSNMPPYYTVIYCKKN